MIQTLVFDFGNVVGFFDHRRAADRLAEYTDLTSEAILAAILGDRLEDDFESGRINADEFVRHVRKLCRLCCPEAEIAAACQDIFWPNPEVCSLIPHLHRRYKLLLGSNTNALHARHFRRQFADVLCHFDALVLSHEVGVRKPKAGFFEHCRQLAGCRPEECVFIDDLPANVAGAQVCGWHGIVYRPGDDLRQRLAALGVRAGEESAA
jgi:putative hydrolase of the HAD superfamily